MGMARHALTVLNIARQIGDTRYSKKCFSEYDVSKYLFSLKASTEYRVPSTGLFTDLLKNSQPRFIY